MSRFRTFVWIVLLSTPAFAGDITPFLGKWEYRQANPGSQSGFDREGEKLEIKEIDGNIAGSYLGLERMGEEGLYYSATNVTGLKITDNHVSFKVPGRSFYSTRPKSIANAEKMTETGFTRMELEFRGKIEDGKLVLQCSSKDNSCPDRQLVFEKGKW